MFANSSVDTKDVPINYRIHEKNYAPLYFMIKIAITGKK